MLVGSNSERSTFREDTRQTEFQAVTYMDERMHQTGHESAKHLRLPRSLCLRLIIEIDALGVDVILQRLVDSFGEQLVGEELEICLVIPRVAEMVSEVVL